MQTTDFDLIIVGAGPAGCTTALSLTGSGLNVALVDKADLPGKKVCGDALSGTVMNVLRRLPGNCYDDFLSLEPKTPSRGIRFTAPCGDFLDLPFTLETSEETPSPGYLCERNIFDGFLQMKVSKLTSFPIISKFKVKQISKEGNYFFLKGENEELRCRMIIGADGVHSVVGKLLGGHSINYRQYCLGARAYFNGVKGLHPKNYIELHFLEELLPGYLWIFPMANGIANVGLGILYEKMKVAPASLSVMLQQIIHSNPLLSPRFTDAEMLGNIGAHGLPLGPDKKKISGEGFLLAGDAAALVDPFSGEGIGNAMISGEIAAGMAREAFETNNFSPSFLGEYDKRIRKKMEREMKTSRKIQQLCSYPSLFNLVVKKANKNKEIKEFFTKMYTNQDARDQLVNPGFYFKILFG